MPSAVSGLCVCPKGGSARETKFSAPTGGTQRPRGSYSDVSTTTEGAMSDPGHEGFARLFSESRAALRRYVQRLVKSRAVSEEIVQEAFLRTYEQGASVQTPRAFLFSIARNLASKT